MDFYAKPPRLPSPRLLSLSDKDEYAALTPKQRYQWRFLALCLEAIRQSGQCDYPPLVQLIERHELETKAYRTELRNAYLQELKQEAAASYEPLTKAIQTLQSHETWTNSSDVLQSVQIIAQETATLERILKPAYSSSSSGATLLKRLAYLRDYLLQKLNDTHFLLPQGLQAEQLMLYRHQQRRVYRYLGELQSVIQDLLEIPLDTTDPNQ